MSTEEKVIRILSENTGHDTSFVTPEKLLLGDLKADSLDLVEMVIQIEEEFDLNIEDSEAEDCKTVGDVIALVKRCNGEPRNLPNLEGADAKNDTQ